jgi:hypothetical protein
MDGAVEVEAGPMAGAVPTSFHLVEGDDAAEMGAGRRDSVKRPVVGPVHRLLLTGDTDDGALSRRDPVNRAGRPYAVADGAPRHGESALQ